MTTLQQASSSRKHFEVGYSLYMAGLSINHCQNIFQRRGWLSAESGHMAALAAESDAETAAYLSMTAVR